MKNLKVTVNGTVYQVQVEEADSVQTPVLPVAPAAPAEPAASAPIEPAAPAAAQKQPKARVPAGGEVIECPMPGTIVDICAEPGRQVKKGEKLLILEAMKMENEIVAPRDAKVAAVMVGKGDSVEAGVPLVSLL